MAAALRTDDAAWAMNWPSGLSSKAPWPRGLEGLAGGGAEMGRGLVG